MYTHIDSLGEIEYGHDKKCKMGYENIICCSFQLWSFRLAVDVLTPRKESSALSLPVCVYSIEIIEYT
jgi:hypothetical protein